MVDEKTKDKDREEKTEVVSIPVAKRHKILNDIATKGERYPFSLTDKRRNMTVKKIIGYVNRVDNLYYIVGRSYINVLLTVDTLQIDKDGILLIGSIKPFDMDILTENPAAVTQKEKIYIHCPKCGVKEVNIVLKNKGPFENDLFEEVIELKLKALCKECKEEYEVKTEMVYL